jgi:hypothetical protein
LNLDLKTLEFTLASRTIIAPNQLHQCEAPYPRATRGEVIVMCSRTPGRRTAAPSSPTAASHPPCYALIGLLIDQVAKLTTNVATVSPVDSTTSGTAIPQCVLLNKLHEKKCPCPVRPSECTNRRRLRTRRRCIETHPPVIVGNKTPRNVPQSTNERHLITHSQPMVQAGAPRCQACPETLLRPRSPHMTCEKLDRRASHRGRSPVKNIR